MKSGAILAMLTVEIPLFSRNKFTLVNILLQIQLLYNKLNHGDQTFPDNPFILVYLHSLLKYFIFC
jgi:hypothetical protein